MGKFNWWKRYKSLTPHSSLLKFKSEGHNSKLISQEIMSLQPPMQYVIAKNMIFSPSDSFIHVLMILYKDFPWFR